MTFVIIGGGIDLSVGALVALASVWATTVATQDYGAAVDGPRARCSSASAAGLVNGAAHRLRQARAVHRHARDAGQRPRPGGRRSPTTGPRSSRCRRIIDIARNGRARRARCWSSSSRSWSLLGWVLLNRTTFGRRTFAIGGNAEAARLAGIDVRRHTAAALRAVGPVLRHRRDHAHGPHDHRLEHARQPLRARRHRRRDHRRHPAHRRPRHASSARSSASSSSRRSRTSSSSTTWRPRSRTSPRA